MKFQFFIHFYYIIIVFAGNNTLQHFKDAGDRLITSLRDLDSNKTHEELMAEKVPIIEEQLHNVSTKYEHHAFILKGLEAVLNRKVESLTTNGTESLDIEFEKVEKSLGMALNISPFEYIKKFKELSKEKVVEALENLNREQNRVIISGNREEDEEEERKAAKEKRKRLDKIKNILTVSLLELGLAQGVADLCALAPFACLLGVTVGSIGFIFWLALIYKAIQ
ncbi:hypothetical protein N7582_003122 [Saccharomyces uvarum]|uniref:Outer spore wall protein 4 n=1 Tax=Saccharomyces uvarum TaxID=230603 RepID=A0AA35J2N5_SACUV|nr:hypothetical protein N7582_003122 [Saccharomyces uvarum]CAI4044398.1 hypothetical protein SUVC_10G1920 [Saccharomyces uvarum]